MLRKKDVEFTVAELNRHINGSLVGDGARTVTGISPFEAPEAHSISFCSEYRESSVREALSKAPLSALILKEGSKIEVISQEVSIILVKDPFASVQKLIPLYFDRISFDHSIHPSSVIDDTATIEPEVHIGPFCYVGPNAHVGKGSILHSNVTLYEGSSVGERSFLHSGVTLREFVKIGSDCVIHNGAVIGADGFGYYPDSNLGLAAVPQVGDVVLGDRVDIGAQSCVDRATLGTTRLGRGTKLDNLVQVGHNCQIGENSLLCALTGVGGSSKIGNQVTLGGNSGVADHIQIVDGVRVGGGAGVTSNLLEKGDYMGYPAVKASDWRRQFVSLKKLPNLIKKIRKLDS